jgi:hyperosmotically inducible protein
VSGKEVVSGSGKSVPKFAIPSVERVLYSTHSQPNLLQRGVTAMKTRTIFIPFLLVLMLMATFVSCASTPKQESTGEYVDDSVITTKIKSLLAADDFLKSFKISVETRKGIVQLSGFVDSQNAVDKAGQIARGVGGVTSVKNDLTVK